MFMYFCKQVKLKSDSILNSYELCITVACVLGYGFVYVYYILVRVFKTELSFSQVSLGSYLRVILNTEISFGHYSTVFHLRVLLKTEIRIVRLVQDYISGYYRRLKSFSFRLLQDYIYLRLLKTDISLSCKSGLLLQI